MWIIDRLEERTAVLEDENCMIHTITRADLPDNVREGDVLRQTDCGWEIDSAETAHRRNRILARQKSLRKK